MRAVGVRPGAVRADVRLGSAQHGPRSPGDVDGVRAVGRQQLVAQAPSGHAPPRLKGLRRQG